MVRQPRVGESHELLPQDPVAQGAAWTRTTTAFALFQALSGYGYSILLNSRGGNHRLLFLISAIAMTAALLADVLLASVLRMTGSRQQNA